MGIIKTNKILGVVYIIKGVNYRVVEVAGLENEYFDKAILYVKADKCESNSVKIDLEARQALTEIIPKTLDTPKCKKYSNKTIFVCSLSIAILILGAFLISYFVL